MPDEGGVRGQRPDGPLRREDAFRPVEDALRGPQTLGGALDRLAGFVASVEDDATLEPYLLGVVNRLAARVAPGGHDPIELAGLEPGRLAGLLRRLRTADVSAPLRDELDEVAGALRPLLALLYAWVGDLDALRAMSTLEGRDTGSDRPDAPDRLGRLQRERDRWTQADSDHRRLLGTVLDGWGGRGEGADLWVPVVERDGPSWARGTLRSVRIGPPTEERPERAVHGGPAGDFARARRAAREVASPGGREGAYLGPVWLGMADAGHEGASADLAVAALCVLALEAHRAPASARRFAPGVVMTGRIDEDGHVRPVDAATLALKVRAAFVSPAEVLVVPETQRPAAEAARGPLERAYPARRLPIVGAAHLRDVIGEPLTEPVPRPLRPSVWRRRVAVGTLVALVVVLLVGIGWAVAMQPVGVVYEGGAMVVEGRFGSALEAVPLEPGLVPWLAADPVAVDGHAALFDVDDDGVQEVVWWDLRSSDGAVVVKVKRPRAAALTWQTVLPEVRAGPGPEASAAPTADLVVGGSTGVREGTTVYVWVLEGEATTPSIMVLDGATGRRISAWVPAE